LALISCSSKGKSGNNEDDAVFVGRPPVIFSEIHSANTNYKDEFGKNSGWVELYNPADTAVNLKGYSLTNDVNGNLWVFGDVVVQPLSYLTVFLSGRDIPNLNLPSDSVNLVNSAIGAWTWADSGIDPPDSAGRSTATHSFSKNTGLSGVLITADNTPILTWSSALIMLKFSGWTNSDVIDISKTNQILLRGSLSKDSKLEIRFVHEDVNDWEAWPAVITGTGINNDLYSIELPSVAEFPELRRIYGLRFSNTSGFIGTINFSFNSIIAHKRGGNAHAFFELKSKGGKLFLMDSLRQIRDSVAYAAEVQGLSFAKNFNTGTWAYSKPPTPNAANSNEFYSGQTPPPTTGIPRSGYYETGLSVTLPSETGQGTVYCDTNGAAPTKNSAFKSGAVLNIKRTTIMRCAQFKDGAYPSEFILRTYIVERLPNLPIVSIAVNPKDMFDNAAGLYMPGLNPGSENGSPPYPTANFWRDTELPIHIDFFENGARHAWSYPAGLRIFGNYSRANPKKSVVITFREEYGQKNLRYSLFPEHPQFTKFKHFILRNNGNNYPNDYIRDMLMTSLTEGLGVDYQKGRSVVVYYNGEYYGIHNLRERSNSDYFETNYGIDEDYIDLVKAWGDVSRGSDNDYKNIISWLEGVTLTDANLKTLEQRLDVDNFTNHFQSRIYYNDRDWPGNNMKRWRRNNPPSKWKFFMYDTDHGFGSYGSSNNETKDQTMLEVATAPNGPDWPNPPWSTFLLRKLLTNDGYKNAFINRFSLLIATYFAPSRVDARINTLMSAIQTEIPHDQAKWGQKSNELGINSIRSFGNSRPAQMQSEIEQFFSLGASVDFTVSAKGNGKVLVHNLPVLNNSATFKAYSTIPVTLKAVPNTGAKFSGWSDGIKDAERTITITGARTLEAVF